MSDDAVRDSEFGKQVQEALGNIIEPEYIEEHYELVIKVCWTGRAGGDLDGAYENLKDDIMGLGVFGGPDLAVERLIPAGDYNGEMWKED
jgi:hypothetical protein